MCTHKLNGRHGRNAFLSLPNASHRNQVSPVHAKLGLRTLYETSCSAPLHVGRLRTKEGSHELHYEVHGHQEGAPAVVVHGGPGAGCYMNHTRFFDLARYKVVLLDQRGCGRSSPRGCLQGNNTKALVSDLDALRQHLGIGKWMLFGGSWGVTLSLAYALAHPDRVTGMILRGVCTMRQMEIDWMYGGGAGALKPWAWQRFLDILNPEERPAPLLGYYRRLLSTDAVVRDAAAQSWMGWEMSVGVDSRSQLLDWDGGQWNYQTFPTASAARKPPRPAKRPAVTAQRRQVYDTSTPLREPGRDFTEPERSAEARARFASTSEGLPALLQHGLSFRGDPGMSTSVAQALLECHYSIHGAFLQGKPVIADGSPTDHEAPILERVRSLRHIPAIAVQGQMDFVCPPQTAFELHAAWPELQLRFVPGAGHSMYDPAITHELLEATTLMYNVVSRDSSRLAIVRGAILPSGAAKD